jgi:long-chain acyl-CoA synthetase
MMQEYTSPGAVPVDPNLTVPDTLWAVEAAGPEKAVLAYRDGDRFVDVTVSEMAHTVRRIAAGLMALGIEKGDRVALFSPTRIEFTYFDYAIWAAAGATVTIYETSSAEQVEWIIGNSEAKALICARSDLKEVFDSVSEHLTGCEHVFVMDDGAIDQLTELGKDISDEDVIARSDSLVGSDLATLVYTSGTTGKPKGCHLTHHNFVYNVKQSEETLADLLHDEASMLIFLPLAHIFARLVQVVSVNRGAKIAYSTGIPNLMEELPMVRPTWLFSVPRVFEKVYNSAAARAADDGKGKIFDIATDTAIAFAKARQEGRVPIGLKLRHGVFDKLVYSKIRDVLGGRAEFAISGGAALGDRLGFYFNGVGLNVLEGYGLTETTAASTVNRPDQQRIGSVGRPVPGTSVRIAEDGEILLKGSHIFTGYWKNEEATAEAIGSDGWFHSGDIGELDDDGYLRITGRKKELIVTAAGKNVAPAVLEDRLRASALVSQCMVVGDAQPFVAAVVTIDPDEWVRFAEQHGKTGAVADNVDDPELNVAVQEAVDEANKAVSRPESIRAFRVLPTDFSVEGGEITPTLKVKRNVVSEKYQSAIDSIYA